jgi:threonine aldolase
VPAIELAKHVDSLMFCLSKGLGCPVGSLIVGSQELIERARKLRKILGGGMRKAGIIAAPGIIALEKMIDRLEEDHQNARLLAERLAKIGGIKTHVHAQILQTNIVNVDIGGTGVFSYDFISKLKKHGVLALPRDKNTVRLVTHRGIERDDILETVNAIDEVVKHLHGRGE